MRIAQAIWNELVHPSLKCWAEEDGGHSCPEFFYMTDTDFEAWLIKLREDLSAKRGNSE